MQECEPALAGTINGHHARTLREQAVRGSVGLLPDGGGDSLFSERSIAELLSAAAILADEIAARPNLGDTAAPLADLRRCAELGLLTAPFARAQGGLGLGTEPGGHAPLLRLLATLGGADLALGRLYEGHVNAIVLLTAFGSPAQLARAARDAESGMLFGVWNTGEREPIRLTGGPERFLVQGAKTFASGAEFVRRPIVTGELGGQPGAGQPGAGWQMMLLEMDAPGVADAVQVDRSFWHPLGMESSESYRVDFNGAVLTADDLVGRPGDFYRNPMFHGGAIRFAAAQAGAVIRLHRMFAEWLNTSNRGSDPYQTARLGEVALASQTAALWVERAGAVADAALHPQADTAASERMVECANMTRLAVERLATKTMQRVTAGVGAMGLLRPHRFERILRDLTTYLRQPAPDFVLAEVGRASLSRAKRFPGGTMDGLWSDEPALPSLRPGYFRQVYEHNPDPWNFQTSEYEAAKYEDTLRTLPDGRFANALEVGSSIGVLTYKLAQRCDALLSLDVSERALAAARERCSALPQVQFRCMEFPREVPEGFFDLVLLSEVAYYWQREDLERAADAVAERQKSGAHVLLVHLTELVPDYPLTGDQVHNAWLQRPEWTLVRGHRSARYRVDLLQRV